MGESGNSLFMDPIVLGQASPMLRSKLSAEDLKIISAPIDFIGVNVYQPSNPILDKEGYRPDDRPKTAGASTGPSDSITSGIIYPSW